MVRGIRPSVEGRTVVDVRDCGCRCRPLTVEPALAAMAKRTRGARITVVRRLAKRVVLQLDTGSAFVIEPRMTGLMLLADPPDREHLRVEWSLRRGRSIGPLWFWDRRGLGTLRLLSAQELHDLEHGGRLGCDPLGLPVDVWEQRLTAVRRPIKVALLDQSLIAGIGNLYASEILHLAGIHPAHPTDRLSRRQLERLSEAADEVLHTAIAYEGSTLSDGTYRNALNQDGGYQNAHRVYDREDQPCSTCGKSAVRRIVQAQRSTFYCPACQRAPRRRSLVRRTGEGA